MTVRISTTFVARVVGIVVVCGALVSCGQRGPLFHPGPDYEREKKKTTLYQPSNRYRRALFTAPSKLA
ncbi:MAG: lipoprotein [Gammaproteobacteria bacterium]|nr:lipoprotein [Gammaproteobacteria bacterium]